MIESLPYRIVQGIFTILASVTIARFNIPDAIMVAVVLIINGTTADISNTIFVVAKHKLRVRFLRKIGKEPTERNISVLESMEYQSV